MRDYSLLKQSNHISGSRLFSCLVCVIVLFLFTESAQSFDVNGFVSVTTEHFQLMGNTMPTHLQETGRVFEDIFSMIDAVFPALSAHVPRPIKVILFESAEDFNELTLYLVDTSKYRYESEYPQGYVMHYSDEVVIITWRGGMTTYLSEMAGDIARVFIKSAVSNPPLWLEEGMVVFFGTTKRFSDRYTVGNIPKDRLEVLRKGVLPIGRLIRIPGNSSLIKEGTDSREIFLVQSAFFISSLFYTDVAELKNGFNHYIRRLINGEDKNNALLSSFPGGLIGLQAHFDKKISAMNYPYTNIERNKFVYRPFSETTPMPVALVHATLGKEYLRHNNLIKAQQNFLRGLSVDETSHDNALGMACVLLTQNQEKAAIPYLERIDGLDEANYQRTLAFFAFDRGHREESLGRFIRCGSALDGDIIALKTAASCAFDLAKIDEARQFVDKLIAVLTDSGEWVLRLTDHLENRGETTRATQYLLTLMHSSIDPSIYVRRFLTIIDRIEDTNSQAAFLLYGLRLLPSSPDIMLRLAKLYDSMGHYQAALPYYRRTLSAGIPDGNLKQRIEELEQKLSESTEENLDDRADIAPEKF